MQTLGERIRAARKEAGMTQQTLAGSDFTPAFISQLENGVVRPSLRSLEVLARRLGKPLDYFLADWEGVDPQHLELAERLLDAGQTREAAVILAPLQRMEGRAPVGVRARRLLGVLLLRTGEPEAALGLLEEALATAGQEAPDELARIHNAIASALDRLQRWDEAEPHLSQALALINSSGEADPLLRLKVETNLAVVYCRLGRYQECKELGSRLLQGASETGLTFRLGELLQTLGVAHQKTGAPESALDYYRMARNLYQLLGDQQLRAGVLQNEGLILLELGRPREACRALAEAAALYRSLGLREQAAVVGLELARIWRDCGDLTACRHGIQEVLANPGSAALEAEGREELAALLAARGEVPAAIQEYERAITLYEAAGQPALAARSARSLGDLLRKGGRSGEARRWLNRARRLSAGSGG